MAERFIKLGKLVRAIYREGQSMEQAYSPYSELSEFDKVKIQRAVLISKVANDIADRLVEMKKTHPPYGLVRLIERDVLPLEIDFELYFETVNFDNNLRARDPMEQVHSTFQETLELCNALLRDTMYYIILSEAKAGNPVMQLPYLKSPVQFIHRGIGTAVDVMSNTCSTILAQYEMQFGRLPMFKDFRLIAERSLPYIVHLATYNLDNVHVVNSFPQGYDNYTEQYLVKLNPETRRLEIVQPAYRHRVRELTTGHPTLITTGCPALHSTKQDLPSPIAKIYHRFLDVVA